MSIALKTTLQTFRSPVSLMILLLLPIGNIFSLLYFIGRDIRDIDLYYHNADIAPVNRTHLVDIFIDGVANSDEFDAKSTSSFDTVINKISDGDALIGFEIGPNFTNSLFARYPEYCTAFLDKEEKEDYPSFDLIDNATIHLAADSTSVQVFTQASLRLTSIGTRLLNDFYKNFNTSVGEVDPPAVNLTEQVYGSLEWEYSDYIGVSIIPQLLFVNSIAMTTMSFVLERKAGLFERAYAGGASVSDYILAFTLHSSVILLALTLILMVIGFAIIGTENEGNLFLYGAISWLASMTGSGLGLLLSSQITDEINAQNSAQMVGGMMAFVSGALWPLNGQPAALRVISTYLPLTKPVGAAYAIASKDLGLGDEPVYLGFITIIGWAVVIYIMAVAFFKRG